MAQWISSSSPDFDIFLYNPGGSLLGRSEGVTRQETIGVSITQTGTYSLQVKSLSGSGPYFVDISSGSTLPEPITPTESSPPQNLQAAAGNMQITLTWNAPATDGSSAITNYNVYRSGASGTIESKTLVTTVGNVLTYTDIGLTNGIPYYYQVTAINGVGESEASNEVSATPYEQITPTQIFFDDFQTGGFGKWVESNEFDWNVETPAERNISGYPSSNLVAHADQCTSSAGCILTMATPLDLTGYQKVTLKFWRYVDNNLDAGEFLRVQIYDGTTWNSIFSWTHGQGDDDIWHLETYDLPAKYLVNNFNLRFISKESSSLEEVEIDDVLIERSN
ncbi:MAG: fibronectin type III domain-containing protein [Nitrososphaerales archaeon]